MRVLFIPILVIMAFGCWKDGNGDFEKNCPYDLAFTGHYLRIPITISPHQSIYNIGDTLNISTVFTDSIYDLGTQQTFKIENFPFMPTSLLYRFDGSGGHSSGYGPNELQIDSIYNPRSSSSSMFANSYRADTRYADGKYSFESKIILKETGRYMLLFRDMYQNHSASGNSDLNAEADAITFDGKCDALRYFLCSVIDSGDTHLNEYEEELIYLNEEVYNNNLSSVRGAIEVVGSGVITVEWNGFFGFEVIE